MSEDKLTETTSLPNIDDARSELDVHRKVVVGLFVVTSLVVISLSVALFLTDRLSSSALPVLPVVAVAGILGAFVSALRRLYKSFRVFPIQYNRLFTGLDSYILCYSTIPALVGMISSVVIYVFFTTGILQGELFPSFTTTMAQQTFADYLSNCHPVQFSDYGKCLIWGFAAGFSEALVPNIIQSISNNVGNNMGAVPPADSRAAPGGGGPFQL